MSGALENAAEKPGAEKRTAEKPAVEKPAVEKPVVEKPAAECERLAGELSALRARTGLSLVALAGRTPYSKSSWQRYLNGTKPLPRQAVTALCALAGEPPGRLLALWELADAAWSGRAAADTKAGAKAGAGAGVGAARGPSPPPPVPARTGQGGPAGSAGPAALAGQAGSATPKTPSASLASPASPTSPPPGGARGRRRTAVLAATAVVAVVTVATMLAAWLSGDDGLRRDVPEDVVWSKVGPLRPGCTGPACEGEAPAPMECGVEGAMTTLGSLTATGGQRLQLRYGETCRTVWVRATGLRVGDRVVLTVPGRREQQIAAVARRDTGRYLVTPMVPADDPSEARACLLPEGGGEQECLGLAPRVPAP
ncbi:helix-turn-helix domain-containing protein [Streptomyces sp. NPDC088182]|uniref:helix-turn-helix domain-containing protein n=1 Tax=Streptomyces sp. NPDC088182 TaxID=3365838 RepID=UPI0037FC7DE5